MGSEKLHNYIQDGRRFLKDSNKRYDLIFSDVYFSLYSIPVHFTTQEFFQLAKSRLTHDGIFMANFINSLSPQAQSLLFSEIRTFRSAFPNSYFLAVDSAKSDEPQNIIFLGVNSNRVIDLTDPEILAEYNDPIIKGLADKVVDLEQYDLSDYILLTDNYAPIEYLTGRLLSSAPELK